jgi:trk system potassium uptake protein TrkA
MNVAVSTPRLLSALVEEAVSVGDLVRLLSFRHGEANLVEQTLAPDSELVGQRVGSIVWPSDVALVAILRDSHVDELMFVAAPDQEDALHEVLSPGGIPAELLADDELVTRVEDDPSGVA